MAFQILRFLYAVYATPCSGLRAAPATPVDAQS